MAEIRKIVIHDMGLYTVTGSVYRWTAGVTHQLHRNVVRAAPVSKRPNTSHGNGPGNLRANITVDLDRTGPRIIEGVVSSNAPYTRYVIHGTETPIMTNKGIRYRNRLDKRLKGPFELFFTGKGVQIRGRPGYWMKLPVNPAFGGTSRFHYAVRGQQDNNFLLKGYNYTQRTHRSLHAIRPEFT